MQEIPTAGDRCESKIAMVLIAFVVEVSLKPSKRQNNENLNEHKTKQSPDKQKDR